MRANLSCDSYSETNDKNNYSNACDDLCRGNRRLSSFFRLAIESRYRFFLKLTTIRSHYDKSCSVRQSSIAVPCPRLVCERRVNGDVATRELVIYQGPCRRLRTRQTGLLSQLWALGAAELCRSS